MAITRATLLSEIADDLNDFGEWSEDEGSYLERQLHNAVDDVLKAHQWAFRIGSTTLSTTSGTLGPYDVPADFEALVSERKINKPFAYDAYAVPPSIPDSSEGIRYPIVYDETVGKIRFLLDPGTGSKTFYYLKQFSTLALALAAMPDKRSLKSILSARTKHYALVNTEDFANQAKTYWDQSELLLNREILRERRGASRPDTRTLLDVNGDPVYYSFQGN